MRLGPALAWLAAVAALSVTPGCDRRATITLDLVSPEAPVRVVTESSLWDPDGDGAPDSVATPIALGSGWAPPDVEAGRRGVWVLEREATLALTILEPRNRRLEIALQAAPVPEGEAQTLEILAGGRVLTTEPLRVRRHEQTLAVPIPGDALSVGRPQLTLRFAQARRPVDVEPGATDTHTLAARVYRIRLVALDSSGSVIRQPAEPAVRLDSGAWLVRAPVLLELPFRHPGAARFLAAVSALAPSGEVFSPGAVGAAEVSVSVVRDLEPVSAPIATVAAGPEPRAARGPVRASAEPVGVVDIRVTGTPGARVRIESPRLVYRSARSEVAHAEASPGAAERPARAIASISPPKRVILVILDAASALHASAYGYARPTTPFLQRLASRGVRFERVYAPAAYTIASSAAILTGLYPERTGVTMRETSLGEQVPTVAGRFHAVGARTCAVVANPNAALEYGALREFDEVHEVFRDRTRVLDPEVPRARSMFAEVLNDLVVDFLSRNSGTPAFVYLHELPPHHPYLAPPPFRGMFASAESGDLIGTWKSIYTRLRLGLDDGERSFARDRYDEHYRYADDGLSKLVDALARAGLDDDTLLVITADHGEAFGEHGQMLHNTTVYEEMVRVPLVIRPPARWALEPRVLRTPVSTVDLLPTLASLARRGELPRPEAGSDRQADPAVDGIDLSDSIVNGVEPPARLLTSRSIESWGRQAIVDASWKYIDDPHERDVELYDLALDPGETRNVIDARPVRALYMSTALDAILARRRARSFPTARATLDGTSRETLKALGYAAD